MPKRKITLVTTCCLLLITSIHLKAADNEDGKKPEINTDASGVNEASVQILNNNDEERPDDQFTMQLFNGDLTIGGEFESRASQRGNYALSDADNDRESYGQKLELEFNYARSERVKALLETKLTYSEDHRVDRKTYSKSLERGESWLDFSRPMHEDGLLGLRVGRQNFSDKREWWWDEDLDGLRLYYASPKLSYELGVAEELAGLASNKPLSENKNDIQRVLGRLKWEYSDGHKLELFALHHDDRSSSPNLGDRVSIDKEDKSDATLNWFGIRARGKNKIKDIGKIRYWADLGAVNGDEVLLDFDDLDNENVEVVDRVEQSVKGTAFDIGVTLESKQFKELLKHRPSFTLGYARGSGDADPNDGIDHAYRQTGIHDNNDKFNGVDSFRYYGELLRPQLSNLSISTASIGYPIGKSSSIEVLYHRYNQIDANENLDSRLRIKPNGQQKYIGEEIDIVLGLEEWEQLELEFVGAAFRAGDAFSDRKGDMSYFIATKLNYNF